MYFLWELEFPELVQIPQGQGNNLRGFNSNSILIYLVMLIQVSFIEIVNPIHIIHVEGISEVYGVHLGSEY